MATPATVFDGPWLMTTLLAAAGLIVKALLAPEDESDPSVAVSV